jgi:hypothetical protein
LIAQCFEPTEQEQQAWKIDFINQIEQVWGSAYRVACSDHEPALDYNAHGDPFPNYDALTSDVIVRVVEVEDNPHYECTVQKIPNLTFEGNWVRAPRPILDSEGEAALDTEDVEPTNKHGHRQRGSIHEFGHMLGLDDEYECEVDGDLVGQNNDSVMSCGEMVYERHYDSILEALQAATEHCWVVEG